jgi:hypothetical protein
MSIVCRVMFTLALVVHLFVAAETSSQAAIVPANTPADLAALRFLLGEWEAVGAPGGETGGFSFAPAVQARIIVRTNTAHYAATDQRPESRHDDLMVIYADGAELKADYFDNEGHVIRYVARLPGPGAVSFVSELKSGEPQYRLTYTTEAGGLLAGQFEIALPGASEVFKPYLAWSARRVK